MELKENRVDDFEHNEETRTNRERYDHSQNGKKPYFPQDFSIVWTPLPLISALFPFIGHVGFVDCNGNCFDFAGPYTVTVNDLAFGEPHKFKVLDQKQIKKTASSNSKLR